MRFGMRGANVGMPRTNKRWWFPCEVVVLGYSLHLLGCHVLATFDGPTLSELRMIAGRLENLLTVKDNGDHSPSGSGSECDSVILSGTTL